jgi:general secretion pathway protein B
MSFILDALKKSESERQRRGTPGIADVPQGGGTSGKSRWMWIIGALLTINLVVLLVLFKRPETPSVAAVPSTDTARPESSEAAPKPAQRFSEIVAEAKRERPPAAVTANAADAEPTATTAPPTQMPLAQAIGAARVVDGPPTFSELRADGTLNMRDLHLDIHVFSMTPSERFIFVNMNRYREGATLEEGPRVAEITPEGVILEYTGMRFLLPRE